MKTEVLLVNPEMAKNFLSKNIINNRSLRKNKVNEYLSLMKKGLWVNNHPNPLVFTPDGQLIDGQHRLNALIKANVNIFFKIDVQDKSVMYTIDSGAKRSPGDACKIAGIKNSTLVAAILKIEDAYHFNGNFSHRRDGNAISNIEIVDKYFKNQDFYDNIVQLTNRFYGRGRLLAPTFFGGYLAVLLNEDSFIVDFFEQLTTGLDIKNNNIYLLRQRLINEISSTKKTPTSIIHALIIKCYNYTIQGKELKTLSFNPITEKYPTLL